MALKLALNEVFKYTCELKIANKDGLNRLRAAQKVVLMYKIKYKS